MDEGKGINKYGDYIVWLQMINKANEENKDIIFVSDEKKEDWRIDGSCRIELIKEFKDKTGREFKLMNLGEFIKYKTSSNSISNCLYQLREFDNNNFKTYYPWDKKYNYFKCISTILKARSDEYTYSKGTDDKAYEELIHIRGIIESFFPSFICGGIIMPNYALEMDIFNKDGLLMQNLCRVYYKTNNCIIIGFAAREGWNNLKDEFIENHSLIECRYEIIKHIYEYAINNDYISQDEFMYELIDLQMKQEIQKNGD